MYWIYIITNRVNSKRYVGFTRNIDKRILRHRNLRSGCPKLANAIKKYGIDCFLVEVVEFGKDDQEGLKVREPFWINKICPEYNLTSGGNGLLNFHHSEETKKKIAESSRKQVWTEERKINIGNSIRGKKRSPFSEDTKRKISQIQKNRKHSQEHTNKVSLALGKKVCYHYP